MLFVILLGVVFRVCQGAEIHLLDDFEINEDMEEIVEVKGLPFEGKAFLFGDKKEDLVKNEALGNEVAKLARVYDGLAVSANVKMDPNQESTLIWIETIYTRPVFGIWIKCEAGDCKLTLLYLLHKKSREVSFENIGPLDDQEWHKLLIHINGMKKNEESTATVYVDCAKQGEEKLLSGYTHLMTMSRNKAVTSKTWLAQRSRGLSGGFEKPWRGSLQNVQFVFNRDIQKLVDQTACAVLKYRKEYQPAIGNTPPLLKQTSNVEDVGNYGKLYADTTQHLEIMLNNQIEETKYLRRLIENMHYGTYTKRKTCALNPCYYSVTCTDTPLELPGYRCGECPTGMEGDGIHCSDIDECALNPCFGDVLCENTAPGYKCEACPRGYRGGVVVGVGRTQAKRKQVCKDMDECAESKTTCSRYSKCVNTMGSYRCGACADGYYGNPYEKCQVVTYCTKPEFNPCDLKANCIQKYYGRSYECVCKVGFTGDGFKCGIDVDTDGVPNYSLACTGTRCAKDNCLLIPNPDQSDLDYDGKGDACDEDMDGDGVSNIQDNCPRVKNPDQKDYDIDGLGDACDNCPRVPNDDQKNSDDDQLGDACDVDKDNDGVLNKDDNCPEIPNERQEDIDKDGVGDVCDNCPNESNPGQEDEDLNFVGDKCTGVDRDKDGIQDSLDNCPDDANAAQLDNDKDGTGDTCDLDDDNDWITDTHDNCPLLPNRFQKYTASHGRGRICKHDFDGDNVRDKNDACPKDARMHAIDFRKHFIFDPTTGKQSMPACWQVYNKGQEVRAAKHQAEPTILIGHQVFENAQFNGTLFINSKEGNNMIGLIFGYSNSKSFFVITWKKRYQRYWNREPFEAIADVGLVIKEVASSIGTSDDLRNALWNSEEVDRQTKVIWKDPTKTPWKSGTAYKWALGLNVPRKTITLNVFEGTEKIISSPKLIAYHYRGGKLGMFTFSQADVIWTALTVKCL